MMRRLFAVLAVPALALGFALASPGTDEAQAMPDVAGLGSMGATIACGLANQMVADSYSYGDYETAQYIENWAAEFGC